MSLHCKTHYYNKVQLHMRVVLTKWHHFIAIAALLVALLKHCIHVGFNAATKKLASLDWVELGWRGKAWIELGWDGTA